MADPMKRGPTGQKKARPMPRPDYLAAVRALPCAVCEAFGEPQQSPTEAHHPIHDRHSQRKRPDTEAIPLCGGHHQGSFDRSKVALHEAPVLWREMYGADHEYTKKTQAMLKHLLSGGE